MSKQKIYIIAAATSILVGYVNQSPVLALGFFIVYAIMIEKD